MTVTITSTVDFAEKYNDFLKITDEMKRFALNAAEYKEVFETGEGKKERRPIVLGNNTNVAKQALKYVEQWRNARDELHKISPERFPLNSSVFNPEPTIISNVEVVSVYLNRAASVSTFKPFAHIKRLKRTLDAYMKKPDSIMYKKEISDLEKEIEFFEENIDKRFRKRLEGYTDVTAVVVHTNGEEVKYKIHDACVFMMPSNPKKNPVTLLQPEQTQNNFKRASIYDSIEAIPSCLPLKGKLYLVDDVVAAENEKARQKHQLGHRKP